MSLQCTYPQGRSGRPLALLPAALLAAGTLGFMPASHAADVSGSVNISASVTTDCTVGTSTLSFGSITSTTIQSTDVDATGTVTVTCTSGTGYTVKLGVGTGTGATFASRKMTAGANLLNYSIYDSAGRTTVWGDGTSSTSTVTGTGSGATQSLTAYGRIFSGQAPPAASYADTVSVTISY
ncbi:MAG: spore coat U domain-containing protein [Pseudohongiellaceae bacterium]|jgi:spore coat protein U-like protein